MNLVWLALAALFYGLQSYVAFYGDTFLSSRVSFWSMSGWTRKYKMKNGSFTMAPPDNWYYKFFNLKYKERFPLSATVLVFVTDGYHLFQFIWIKCVLLAVATTADGNINWIVFFIGWIVWSVLFNTSFLGMGKLKKKTN